MLKTLAACRRRQRALALPELLRVLPYRWYFPLVHRMTGL